MTARPEESAPDLSAPDAVTVSVQVDGRSCRATVAPGARLVDVLREEWDRPGVHVGCLTGDCGACTVVLDGETRKSCLLLAAAIDGVNITTIEGLGESGLTDVQEAFWVENAFQCGYCTGGMVLVVHELLGQDPDPDETTIRRAISGNLCRCTGYEPIVAATRRVAAQRRAGRASGGAAEGARDRPVP